jgi:DNA-binding transcriptional ArsR family regulator
VTRPPVVPEVDVLLHEPARLRVLALLALVEEADFMYLLRRTGLSRGNLSVQMSRLEEAGIVRAAKELAGGRPRTTYQMTETGRESLRDYKHTMLGLLAPFPD